MWRIALVVAVLGCGRSGFEQVSDGNVGGRDDATTDDSIVADAIDDAVVMLDGPSNLVAIYTPLPVTSPPTPRRASGAAVGPDDRIWIFGGFVGGVGAVNGVAAYVPGSTAWQYPTATNPPPARERHVLGFDPGQNVLVLFGGYAGSFPTFTHHDELFIFSPTTSAWTPIPKAGSWPVPRKDSAMVWVPSLNRLLLYGGNNGSGASARFGDLWTLAVDAVNSTATWTQLTPTGVTPPKQSAPCAAYDPAARRLILYGGETQDGGAATTTFQYLVDTNAWQLDAVIGTSPSDRAFSNCAWDPVIERVVLFGGQNSGGTPVGGTYLYDPALKRWNMLALDATSSSPGNCSDGGAAYSAALGGMFVFGGRTAASTYTNQSWLVDVAPD